MTERAVTVGTPPNPLLAPEEVCTHPVVVVEAIVDDPARLWPTPTEPYVAEDGPSPRSPWADRTVQVEIGRCPACFSVFSRTSVHPSAGEGEVLSTAWAWLAGG